MFLAPCSCHVQAAGDERTVEAVDKILALIEVERVQGRAPAPVQQSSALVQALPWVVAVSGAAGIAYVVARRQGLLK